MTASEKHLSQTNMIGKRVMVFAFVLALCGGIAQAQKDKAKSELTGSYEGIAKNKAEEVIKVTFELTEKAGGLSGMIRSDHGDFTITGGSHQGDAVTLEFDAGGPTGTISLKLADDKLTGTWSAGEDGGSVEVKRAVAQAGGAKEKS
jgi:hypothetical protein